MASGYAPYEEAQLKASSRMNALQYALAGLQGLSAVPRGANFGEAFLASAGASSRAYQASQQAAQEYAMRREEAKRRLEEDAIQKRYMEAQIKNLETTKPEKKDKPEPWQLSPEDYAKHLKYETDLAKARAAGKPIEKEKPEKPKLGDLNVLSDNFRQEPSVKNFGVVRDSFKRIESSAKLGTGQGDLAIIFSFMKVLDPESVVRETEFSNAAQAVGRLRQTMNIPQQWVSGQRLTPEGRAGFRQIAKDLYDTQKRTYETTAELYKRQAKAYGVDSSLIIPQYGDGSEAADLIYNPETGDLEPAR